MKITEESLKAHDYAIRMKELSDKSVELRKKAQELTVQLNESLKQYDELLHPKKDKNK